jgi:hypothetical protein
MMEAEPASAALYFLTKMGRWHMSSVLLTPTKLINSQQRYVPISYGGYHQVRQ